MKRMSFLLLIGIVAFGLSVAYGGYKFWQKSALQQEAQQIESSLSAKKKEILEYQDKNLKGAISAKQVVNELQTSGVKWSEVIKLIRKTLPVQESGPLVEVLSYAASSNKAISLNVKTVPGSETPYFDVAKLIRSFDDSESFEENFVPSISGGSDDEGREVLSFTLLTTYTEDTVAPLEGDLQGALTEVLDEALVEEDSAEESTPVPR